MLADNESVKTTLISGDPEFCKTFIFEAAISWAKEGQQVYYFSPKQIEYLPPAYHKRSEPSADVLKHMTFIYTSTYDDFAGQLVKLQTFQRPPSILFVDDIDFYSDQPKNIKYTSRELHVARCCAIILNAALSCSKVLTKPVHVCALSFNNEHENIYKKYFDNRWNVSVEPNDNNTDENRRIWMKRTDEKVALEFCRLEDAVLVLKRIYQTVEDETSSAMDDS